MSIATEAGGRTRTRDAGKPSAWRAIRREFVDPEKRTAYWMIIPTILVVLVIAAWPIMYAIILSLFRILPTGRTFIGLDNYVTLFSDPIFWGALLNTVIFTVASVALEFGFGLAIALVLNRGFIGRGAARAIAIVPCAFPTVVSGLMWRLMYQDGVGIFAYLAERLNLISGPILADSQAVLIGAIASDVWKTTPFVALLLLAGRARTISWACRPTRARAWDRTASSGRRRAWRRRSWATRCGPMPSRPRSAERGT